MYIEISHNKKTFARCLFISVKVSIAVFEYFNICFKRAISRWNCEIFIFTFQNFNRDDSDFIFEFVSINSKIKLKKYEKKEKLKSYFWTEMNFYSSPLTIVSVLKYWKKKIALKKREFFNCCHNKVTIIFYSKNLSITWILDWGLLVIQLLFRNFGFLSDGGVNLINTENHVIWLIAKSWQRTLPVSVRGKIMQKENQSEYL